jgi:hypothetical protein
MRTGLKKPVRRKLHFPGTAITSKDDRKPEVNEDTIKEGKKEWTEIAGLPIAERQI